MFTSRDLLWGVAAPALISLIALVIGRIARRPLAETCSGAVGMAIGFIIAYLGIVRRSPLPPHESPDWLCLLAGWCMGIAVADPVITLWKPARSILVALSLLIVGWLLLRPLNELPDSSQSWLSGLALTAWVVGIAVIGWMWWIRLDHLAQSESSALVLALMALLAAAVGLGLLLSSSKLLGQLGGVVAVTIVPPFALSLRADLRTHARGIGLVYVPLILSLLVCSHFYATLTVLNAILFLASGLLITAGTLVPTRGLQGWKRNPLLVVLAAIPAGIAVTLAAIEFAASMAESSGYSY